MAIKVSQAFSRTSANPIDESLALTKAQMKTVNDNLMPSKYFTVGQDDGCIYLYDKSNTADPETGKFRKFEGGGTGGASNLADLEDVLLTSLANGQTLIWDETEAKWVNGSIGSGGGHTIEDAEGTDLTQRDTLQFGEGLLVEDDDTNEKTVVALDPMPSEDMDEVVDVYPTAGELVSIVNAFNRSDIYSTDEKMIGRWIDGKPLYQKTIVTNAPVFDSSNWCYVLTNASIETVVSQEHQFYTSGDNTWNGCNQVSSTNNFVGKFKVAVFDNNNVNHPNNIGWYHNPEWSFDPSTYILYSTIQYTKTTDTAISIGEATEYSTDEKVVGTWIDGRPIYQRTYEQEIALTPNTWVASSLVATNVDKVINGIGYNAGSSIDCLLSGVVNGYFGFNSTRSQSIAINAFTVQYLKTT